MGLRDIAKALEAVEKWKKRFSWEAENLADIKLKGKRELTENEEKYARTINIVSHLLIEIVDEIKVFFEKRKKEKSRKKRLWVPGFYFFYKILRFKTFDDPLSQFVRVGQEDINIFRPVIIIVEERTILFQGEELKIEKDEEEKLYLSIGENEISYKEFKKFLETGDAEYSYNGYQFKIDNRKIRSYKNSKLLREISGVELGEAFDIASVSKTEPFPDYFKRMIEDSGKSYRTIAEEIGKSSSYIGTISSGRAPVPPELINKLAKTLNIDNIRMFRGRCLIDYLGHKEKKKKLTSCPRPCILFIEQNGRGEILKVSENGYERRGSGGACQQQNWPPASTQAIYI